jgi:hypothetical protein
MVGRPHRFKFTFLSGWVSQNIGEKVLSQGSLMVGPPTKAGSTEHQREGCSRALPWLDYQPQQNKIDGAYRCVMCC